MFEICSRDLQLTQLMQDCKGETGGTRRLMPFLKRPQMPSSYSEIPLQETEKPSSETQHVVSSMVLGLFGFACRLCVQACRGPSRGLTQTMTIHSWLQRTGTWLRHARHACLYSTFSLHLPSYMCHDS